MNEILVKALKGLGLAVVFGGISYLLLKDIFPACLIAGVMFLSMFIKPKQM